MTKNTHETSKMIKIPQKLYIDKKKTNPLKWQKYPNLKMNKFFLENLLNKEKYNYWSFWRFWGFFFFFFFF